MKLYWLALGVLGFVGDMCSPALSVSLENSEMLTVLQHSKVGVVQSLKLSQVSHTKILTLFEL